jgi:hypothetical protein
MSLSRRIANLFSRSKVEREIDAELRSHIEMRIEDNIAGGMASSHYCSAWPELHPSSPRVALRWPIRWTPCGPNRNEFSEPLATAS